MSNTEDQADPKPPPTFEVLPLSSETLGALSEMGYTHPTPVQRVVFEPATRGLDLVVQARTGTGKTAAFGLPIVEHVVRRQLAKVQVLVLCPTRELALQVTGELTRLGKPRDIKPVAIYGGAPMDRQVDGLRSGAQVVVGTPGRVLDHLTRKTLDPDNIRMVVLDEADEMLSMGFERELSAILERMPRGRQTLLFSATIPPDIERIARDRLHDPEFITLSGDHIGALEVVHFVYLVRGDKVDALKQIIEVDNPESALVFCNTRGDTSVVAEALQRQGFAADWLNGDLPQNEREKVMASTREGRLRFLVATDVAARGIDISHLTHVINFDMPETPVRYVHRTGRTGRAGRTGTAISLVTPKDIGNLYLLRLTYKIRPIERQLPTAGERRTRAEADLVQLLADAFVPRTMHPDDLALARRLLSHDDAEHIVAGLVRDHLGARPDPADEAAAARRSKTSVAQLPPDGPPARPRTAALRPRDAARRGRERPEQRALPRGVQTDEASGVAWTEERSTTDTEPSGSSEEGSFVEIFVNVGRRDGVGASELQLVLTETAGLSPTHLGRIRVRDRSSFVAVKRDVVDRAVAALNGAILGGKTVQAEPARARSTRSSSPNER